MNTFEVPMESANIKELFIVSKIDVDKVTFRKYDLKIPKSSLLSETTALIELNSLIGEETHLATPDIVAELAGKTGTAIKGFTVKVTGKTRKKVLINSVEYLLTSYSTSIDSLSSKNSKESLKDLLVEKIKEVKEEPKGIEKKTNILPIG